MLHALIGVVVTLQGAAACLGINLIYAVISFSSQPFIDNSADYMDVCARIASTLTLVFALVSMPGILEADDIFEALTITFNVLNLVCMVCLMLYSIPWVQNKYKEIAAVFELDDTVLGISSYDPKKVVQRWNLPLELRHRSV